MIDEIQADAPQAPAPRRSRRELRTVQHQRHRRRRLVKWGLSIGVSILMVNAIVGENGYLATLRVRREEAELMRQLSQVRVENQRLQDLGRRLQHDPAALEEAARRELGLMRPGETLVIIHDTKPAQTPPIPK